MAAFSAFFLELRIDVLVHIYDECHSPGTMRMNVSELLFAEKVPGHRCRLVCQRA